MRTSARHSERSSASDGCLSSLRYRNETAVTLGLFHYYRQSLGAAAGVAQAQTVAFTGMIVIEKINVFNFRALRAPLTDVGLWSNPWILVAISVTLCLQVAAVYVPFLQHMLHTVPLNLMQWGLIVVAALPIFVFVELYEYVRSRGEAQRAVLASS